MYQQRGQGVPGKRFLRSFFCVSENSCGDTSRVARMCRRSVSVIPLAMRLARVSRRRRLALLLRRRGLESKESKSTKGKT